MDTQLSIIILTVVATASMLIGRCARRAINRKLTTQGFIFKPCLGLCIASEEIPVEVPDTIEKTLNKLGKLVSLSWMATSLAAITWIVQCIGLKDLSIIVMMLIILSVGYIILLVTYYILHGSVALKCATVFKYIRWQDNNPSKLLKPVLSELPLSEVLSYLIIGIKLSRREHGRNELRTLAEAYELDYDVLYKLNSVIEINPQQ